MRDWIRGPVVVVEIPIRKVNGNPDFNNWRSFDHLIIWSPSHVPIRIKRQGGALLGSSSACLRIKILVPWLKCWEIFNGPCGMLWRVKASLIRAVGFKYLQASYAEMLLTCIGISPQLFKACTAPRLLRTGPSWMQMALATSTTMTALRVLLHRTFQRTSG